MTRGFADKIGLHAGIAKTRSDSISKKRQFVLCK